jgi:two-component system, OmpR family, alkaline phosphatase synthesis response regulator PhoP
MTVLAPQLPLDPSATTIVVVDDEPYILRSLTFLLSREGFLVETAADGEEGLKRIQEHQPKLVFLDVMMPRMNGYQVCAAIRGDPRLADTHVIMLSAKGQQVDREKGLNGGADEYMTKPFSPREVADRVRMLLVPPAAGQC